MFRFHPAAPFGDVATLALWPMLLDGTGPVEPGDSFARRGSIPYPNEWKLLNSKLFGVTTSDFALCYFTRTRNDLELFGGQTLLFGDDERWVHSRALKPFRGARLEGVKPDKEPEDAPVLIVAQNLRIAEASEYSGDDEIAVVPADTALTIRFESSEALPQIAQSGAGGENGATTPGGGYQYTITDYASGAVVAQGVVSTHVSNTFEIVLPDGLPEGSFGLYVNLTGVEKAFAWPLDYTRIAGETEFKPARYKWIHPTRGALFYDPRYDIGARPYDLSDPTQKALLDERAALVADSENLDRAEWASYLITFNADGSQVTSGGEYSALKILSGDSVYVGDRNVHLNALPGLHAWQSNGGVLEPFCIEPRIRSVKFLEEHADGIWISGHLAGRNGRITYAFLLDDDLNIIYQAYGDLQSLDIEREYSRKLAVAEAGCAIVRDRGELLVQTPLALLRLDPRKPASRRLVVHGVGGFDLAQVTRLDGQQTTGYTIDPDLLSDAEKEGLIECDNYLQFTSQTRAARGLSKHTASTLIPFNGAFYAVDESTGEEETKTPFSETEEEGEDNTQQLVRFVDGGRSVREIWRKNQFDAGRGHAAGPYALVYGFNRLFEPRVLRVGKGIRQMGLKSPYIPLRCGSTLSGDGTTRTGWLVGKKLRGFKQLPGWYVAETTGDLAKVEFTKSPDNSGYEASVAALTAAGFSLGAFPNFLVWLDDLRQFRTTSTQPTPGEIYLALDNSSDPVRYFTPDGVTLPFNIEAYCKLEFEAAAISVSQTPPPSQNCGKMDLAIVVDTTGSMGGAIDNIRKEIPLIIADLQEASGGDYRAALVGADNEITVYVPFSDNNGAAIEAALPNIYKAGGAEPTDEAIRTVLDALPASARNGQQVTQVGDFSVPFRADARNIIVLITDDMPNGLDFSYDVGVDDVNAHAMAVQAAAQGVRISAVYVPTGQAGAGERDVTPIMEAYAGISDGIFVRAQPSGQGVGQAISDIVNSCGGDVPPDSPIDSVDGLVRPLPCCDSAACVASTQADPYVIVLRYPERDYPEAGAQTAGPMSAASFAAKEGDAAFRAAMAESQVLWLALDDVEIDIPPNIGLPLTEDMIAELEKATIPMNYRRPHWFGRETKHFTIIAIRDGGAIECSDLVYGPVI